MPPTPLVPSPTSLLGLVHSVVLGVLLAFPSHHLACISSQQGSNRAHLTMPNNPAPAETTVKMTARTVAMEAALPQDLAHPGMRLVVAGLAVTPKCQTKSGHASVKITTFVSSPHIHPQPQT